MRKLKFSERVNGIFAAMDTNYDEMNNLMQDLALGREIFDEESGRVISKAEANAKILAFSKSVLGVEDGMGKKEINRCIRDNGRAWFDIIEDTIDLTVELGLKNTDWFQALVDFRSIRYGDRQDFVIETNEAILATALAGTSHHSHTIQRLAGRQVISVATDLYVVKIGADINRYILGQVDWTKLVNAITKAYETEILDQIYAEVSAISTKMPIKDTRFVNTGALTTATKDDFDEIVANVSMANNGANVYIFGSKYALSKVGGLTTGAWAATAQKDNVMNTGYIGMYDGTPLVMMPNRFKDKAMTTTAFPQNKILILPEIGDEGKMVKMLDEGDTYVLTREERGDYLSDIMTMEVQRRFGVTSVVGRQIGEWTLP